MHFILLKKVLGIRMWKCFSCIYSFNWVLMAVDRKYCATSCKFEEWAHSAHMTAYMHNLAVVNKSKFGYLWNFQEFQLRDGSSIHKNWIDTPIPIYIKFRMFNWTNPLDIHKPNYKPNVVEMGPYVFLEKHTRVNVTFHSENDTVSFDQIRTWHFMPEMSNGTLDDQVTNVNVIAAVRISRTTYPFSKHA